MLTTLLQPPTAEEFPRPTAPRPDKYEMPDARAIDMSSIYGMPLASGLHPGTYRDGIRAGATGAPPGTGPGLGIMAFHGAAYGPYPMF